LDELDLSSSSSLSLLGSITGGDGGGSLLREEESESESESDEAMVSFEFFQISLFIFARSSRDDIIASVYEHLSSSLFISLADDDVVFIIIIIIIIARKMRVCLFFCKVYQTRGAL
jgi:hypothetical protein